ncbi:MAG: bifunctional 4-hydroxy-2-oxoglutarate aldolase/2-dehydro-3-deoxy-phosphogluconate aldolase [Lachnospiraceae bacterium]|jgi:2-dehydro-3-deoxyphosphogluconate aldolase/(4S)-4-hydroxy-2-oxoglutarate aldolase|nr:bifunctional 4-hydroxy-2-oxoglutarate aldolase/2-dehydro-3-deoxy-phosphogluconate aldolase [Lachnospiraceae bacterium]
MPKKPVLEEIGKRKLVPVVKLDRAEDTRPLCETLTEGGLPCAEITFRTEAAEESIRIAVNQYPDMLVGAGTVTNVEQAERAVQAGAKFLVSPGFSEKVAEYAAAENILLLPGICTPSEIMKALEYNMSVVKFYPAEQFGGIRTIKALTAPFPAIRFLPTGGIYAGNIQDYLQIPQVLACGGSWMVASDLIRNGNYDEILRLTREAVKAVDACRKG